ncbi:small multi-drug export protein, partial [Clostridioides difficile]|uniref:small multi-drug export protein n=1 Tax=Clostridioides difficile TaxID=1496 RepID=UPI0020B18A36
SRMKKLKSVSIIGIILFVGIPLPTTGTWTASAIASILKMRIKDAFMGVFLGNLLSGVIVSALSLHTHKKTIQVYYLDSFILYVKKEL